MTKPAERLISLALLAAIAALALAAAAVREDGSGTLFYVVAAVAAGGFVARLRPTR